MGEWTKSISLRGKLEMADGKYVFVIPLSAGGNEFIKCSEGISKVEGQNLIITIPDWMVANAGLHNGSFVDIDNRNGQFNFDAALEP
jgi:hypothetical protein